MRHITLLSLVLAGIAAETTHREFSLAFCSLSSGDYRRSQQLPKIMRERRADGFLFDHFGPAVHLFLFGNMAAVPESIRAEVDALRQRGVPIRIVTVLRGEKKPVQGADLVFGDEGGHFWEKYGVLADGAAYLVRPDQHVCARWMNLSPDRLRAALTAVLGNT